MLVSCSLLGNLKMLLVSLTDTFPSRAPYGDRSELRRCATLQCPARMKQGSASPPLAPVSIWRAGDRSELRRCATLQCAARMKPASGYCALSQKLQVAASP